MCVAYLLEEMDLAAVNGSSGLPKGQIQAVPVHRPCALGPVSAPQINKRNTHHAQ